MYRDQCASGCVWLWVWHVETTSCHNWKGSFMSVLIDTLRRDYIVPTDLVHMELKCSRHYLSKAKDNQSWSPSITLTEPEDSAHQRALQPTPFAIRSSQSWVEPVVNGRLSINSSPSLPMWPVVGGLSLHLCSALIYAIFQIRRSHFIWNACRICFVSALSFHSKQTYCSWIGSYLLLLKWCWFSISSVALSCQLRTSFKLESMRRSGSKAE